MCLDIKIILNSQLPLVGLKIVKDIQFMYLLSKYSQNKSENNYKCLEKRLRKIRNDFLERLKVISTQFNQDMFHLYVLDSDFNIIVSDMPHLTALNRAVSVTYQMANNNVNYNNAGTLSSYTHQFMPPVIVKDTENNKDIIINDISVGTYASNAAYEGSYKSLYFGAGAVL